MKKSTIMTNAAKLLEFLCSVNVFESVLFDDDISDSALESDTQLLACSNTVVLSLPARAEATRRRS